MIPISALQGGLSDRGSKWLPSVSHRVEDGSALSAMLLLSEEQTFEQGDIKPEIGDS